MKRFVGYERGMGIGGWLTNYKRFNVLPDEWRMPITIGDLEHFESFITERDIAYIASLGMDHIRLGFDQIVLEESPYVYRERTLQCIDRCLEWCKQHGLNVVLNLHKCLGNYCDVQTEEKLFESEELQKRMVALWKMLARRYANCEHAAFELLNEVTTQNPEEWNRLAERCVQAIRKITTERIIVVGSVGGNYPCFLKDLRVWEDERIVYTFHYYSPAEFTHQRGVLKSMHLYYNREMPYPCDDVERYRDFWRLVGEDDHRYDGYERIDRQVLRDGMQGAVDFIEQHPDKILWCGEFGTIRHCPTVYRENWMHDMIEFCKDYGIPYCVWNYLSTPNDGNRFSLVDDDRREIISERMAQIIRGEL